MKILIFGAGGVGSVVGGFLARMGHDVSLLGRAAYLDPVIERGLILTGIWGDYRVKAFTVYRSHKELLAKKPDLDLIMLTVKSYDTEQAVGELVPLLGERTMLLALQNGLGNIETILKRVPAERFLAGRVIFGVETEPGLARVTVSADAIRIGAMPQTRTLVSAESLAHTFTLAKLDTRPVGNILSVLWAKAIYNCALNAICTLHEIPYGRILESAATQSSMESVVRECYAVAQAKGILLDVTTPEAYVRCLTQDLIPRTAAHYPSMLQDIRKGKRTDIDALNGAIVRYGRESGVPTPENESLTAAIHHKMGRDRM